MTDDDWTPAEKTGELIVAIAAGRADPLSGRFIHVLDDLLARIRVIEDEDLYTLRLRTPSDD